MNFDQLGQSWRDENQTVSAEEHLEHHVKTTRSVERFTGSIFRRDLIESLVCLYLIYTFGSMLFNKGLIASTALPSVFVFGVVVNVLGSVYVCYRLNRARMSTPQPKVDAPMREYVETELTRVEKQMALLRSVHLWYLGPFYVGVNAMFLSYDGFCIEFVIAAAAVTALYAFIYAMNRHAESTSMRLIRDELTWMRDQLDEKEGTPPASYDPVAAGKETLRFVLRWFLILITVGVGGALLGWWLDVDYPKRSPFDAVRWHENQPEVRLNDEWFRLVSIDGVTADEIVEYCDWTYFQKSRKRFEEDLVEVLTHMGHEPDEAVTLVVSPLDGDEPVTLQNVPMSEKKRWRIKNAARLREEKTEAD
ncbi:hypothetical protein MalM25_35290 [Planctomycetes bacterium MalM25]|nr:hypothetical protein MalM25_35290 [Planctomycetes bacterium MalM25]